MNHYPEAKPKDKQLCLIYNGVSIQPSEYRADEDRFYRYSDHHPDDRTLRFFYLGVLGWWPFPEMPKETQFVAEQEKPIQRDVDAFVDDMLNDWNTNYPGGPHPCQSGDI